jgi:hypothetical protein
LSPGPGFGLIVHHTDAEREYASDRKAEFGRLDRACAPCVRLTGTQRTRYLKNRML